MSAARSGAWCLVITALCAAMVTACGSGPGGSPSSSSPSSGAAAQPAKISLDVTVTGSAGTKVRHWTLRCEPAGGTHPDPAAACHVLQAAKTNPFGPLPKGIMCPMIVAGAERAKVTGTWYGTKVDTTIFDGGCYLQRWAKIGQIFN
jgi:hypothetical protein